MQEKFEKRSFISKFSPTVHTNPSWDGFLFSKTPFKPEELENASFVF